MTILTSVDDNLLKKLELLLAQTSLEVSLKQRQQLVAYVMLLNKWNKAYNLTSVRDPMEMLVKHIIDSLVVSPHLQGDHFIDVGTGPGLPGIPLAIVNPDRQFTLLDSLGKRVVFLKQVVHELQLANVHPVQSRVEDYQPEQKFDAVISRAFASIQDMCQWCQHLLSNKKEVDKKESNEKEAQKDGLFIALKGQLPENELNQLPEFCQIVDIKQLIVPELIGERHLVILKII